MLLLISNVVILALKPLHCLRNRYLQVTISVCLVFPSLLTVRNLEDRLDRLLAAHGLVVRVARIRGLQVRRLALSEGLLRYLSSSRVVKRRVLAEVRELPRASVLMLTFLNFILPINMVL